MNRTIKDMKHEFKMKQMELLHDDLHNITKINWTVNSFFITAAFALTAFLFTQNPDSKFFIILTILSMIWFIMFYTAGMSKVIFHLLGLEKKIVEGLIYDLKTIKGEFPASIRTIYILNLFIIAYHIIFIIYCYQEISTENGLILIILLLILVPILFVYQDIKLSTKVSKWVFNSKRRKFR